MSDLFIKYAGLGISNLYTQIINYSDHTIEFIDPLTCIIKLIILNFKPIGTKISIKNNIMNIQDVSLLQGCQRFLNHDDRDNLHQLRLSILYFKGLEQKYITYDNITNTSIKKLNLYAIKGLIKLRETYETSKRNGSMVLNCLDEYIRILKTDYLNIEKYAAETDTTPKAQTLFKIYNNFVNLWYQKDIDIILSLINYIEIKQDPRQQNILAHSINSLLDSMEIELNKVRPV